MKRTDWPLKLRVVGIPHNRVMPRVCELRAFAYLMLGTEPLDIMFRPEEVEIIVLDEEPPVWQFGRLKKAGYITALVNTDPNMLPRCEAEKELLYSWPQKRSFLHELGHALGLKHPSWECELNGRGRTCSPRDTCNHKNNLMGCVGDTFSQEEIAKLREWYFT